MYNLYLFLLDLARPLVKQGSRRLNRFAFIDLSRKHLLQIKVKFSTVDFIGASIISPNPSLNALILCAFSLFFVSKKNVYYFVFVLISSTTIVQNE